MADWKEPKLMTEYKSRSMYTLYESNYLSHLYRLFVLLPLSIVNDRALAWEDD